MLKSTAGDTLKRARFAKDLTLDKLAELSGVSVATIVRIEAGKGAYGRTIFSLAPHLDIDPNSLFESETEEAV